MPYHELRASQADGSDRDARPPEQACGSAAGPWQAAGLGALSGPLALVAIAWGLGLVQALFYVLSDHLDGSPMPWSTYSWNWLRYGLAGVALPWLAARGLAAPFRRERVVSQLAAHGSRALVAIVCVALGYAGLRLLNAATGGQPYDFDRLYRGLLWNGLGDLFLFTGVGALGSAIAAAQRLREQESRAARLAATLSRAELESLQSQLQPHFLFNALNTVSSLISREPATADLVVARLGDFLRQALQPTGRQVVPLGEELGLLQSYLDIQRARFRARLRIAFEVEPAAQRALVPRLVLQPLVENAFKHGIDRRLAGGELTVRARRDRDRLVLEVEESAPEESAREEAAAGAATPGTGLANTRDRLRLLYGDRQALELDVSPTGGSRARLSLPFAETAGHEGGSQPPPPAAPRR